MKKLIVNKSFALTLPGHVKIHPVTYVSHSIPFLEQSHVIAAEVPAILSSTLLLKSDGHFVDRSLIHRKSERELHLLTSLEGYAYTWCGLTKGLWFSRYRWNSEKGVDSLYSWWDYIELVSLTCTSIEENHKECNNVVWKIEEHFAEFSMK